MKIIERHYLKEFIKLFIIIAVGIGFILSLTELINKVEAFSAFKPPLAKIIFYGAMTFPGYLIYLMPMAGLMSSLFIIGYAGRKKETLAIKAAGGSLKKILMPIVYAGIVISLVAFLISEFIVPDLSEKAHKLSDSIIKKESLLTFKEGTAWLRKGDHIVRIGVYQPDRGLINGISILKISDDMLTERTEARFAEWKPVLAGTKESKDTLSFNSAAFSESGRGLWNLRDVTVYDINTGRIVSYPELQSDVIDPPDILSKGMQKPEEMNLRELFRYTKKLREAGIKNVKMLVDMHSRLSFPIINIIMIIIGISLASRGKMESGLITTAIAVFISLIYWLGYTTALSMGYTGILPPVFAAWLIPFIFGGAAVYLFSRIPE